MRIASMGGPVLGGLLHHHTGSPAALCALQALFSAAAAGCVLVSDDQSGRAAAPRAEAATAGAGDDAAAAGSSMLATLCALWRRLATAGAFAVALTLVRSARVMVLPLVGRDLGERPSAFSHDQNRRYQQPKRRGFSVTASGVLIMYVNTHRRPGRRAARHGAVGECCD
eukprot:COSAG01_NODE_23329_length_819_cov_1.430556_2_plen_168_part_01